MDLGDGSSWLFVPLQILVVDLLLGADNALVIALACRSLAPEDMRRAGHDRRRRGDRGPARDDGCRHLASGDPTRQDRRRAGADRHRDEHFERRRSRRAGADPKTRRRRRTCGRRRRSSSSPTRR